MAISSIFAKFKGLGPVLVVGTAVLVTVKLLTTKTPTTEESLVVKAEEDIKTEDYKEDIVIPEPEPEVPAKEEKSESEESDQEEDEEEKETEEAGEETEEEDPKEAEQNQEQQPPQEQPKSPPRKWLSGKGNKVVDVLQKIFAKQEKQ